MSFRFLQRSSFALVALMLAVSAARADETAAAKPAKSRTFRFDYAAKFHGLPEGAKVKVWLPVPPSNDYQQVELLERDLPANGNVSTESKYGNKILYFETKANATGTTSFKTLYRITRKEVRGLADGRKTALSEQQRELFLAPNRRVPVDGKPLDLLAGRELPEEQLAMARLLYDRVDEHVRYDKSQPGYGQGDVAWVCDSRFGNCTDFHSLFISLSRAKGMPARFEIGFPLPHERGKGSIGGYHCWAFFYSNERGWVPVDISEADKHPEMKEYYFTNLTENRVTFSTGRDIDLVPKQAGPSLNFFVYPYVEFDGKPLPTEQIELDFCYADQ